MNHLTPARHPRKVRLNPISSAARLVRWPAAGAGNSTMGHAVKVAGRHGYTERGTWQERYASLTTVGALANSSGLQTRLTEAVQHV